MSLILEALRKSEAERRRAQAPDLFAPAQVAVASAPRVPPWVVGGGVLAMVAVALLLVRAFAPATEPVRPANAVVATDAPPRAGDGPAPASSAVPPVTAPRLLPAAEKPRATVTGATPPEPVRQASTATPKAGEGTAEPAPATEPAEAPPARAAQTAPVATAREPAAAPDTGAPPMRLSELVGDARRQLPPLRLTMHMWNEVAERRFVILDGHRLGEGDRLGAVRVAEIRRDGVILDWNGQWLELPLR